MLKLVKYLKVVSVSMIFAIVLIGLSCISFLTALLISILNRQSDVIYHLNYKPSSHLWKEIFPFEMCTNKRWYVNRYTGQRILANCGHCKACLQAKAIARTNRIRAEYDGKNLCYFGTLTYSRYYVPYFLHSEAKEAVSTCSPILNVYRDCSVKWIPSEQRYRITHGQTLLDSPSLVSNKESTNWFPYIKGGYGKVGVVYYKDIQDFFKRFRQNIKRKGYDIHFKMFQVAEYGGKTIRPHFHFLLWAPSSIDQTVLHEAACESWPYGRRIREKESFQLVRDDPAGYVSSYVNCGNRVPSFLAKNFAQKHSFSKFFGHSKSVYSLASIQELVSRGNLSYSTIRTRDFVPECVNIPIPKYVVNRWFPLFKGYSRFADDKVYDFLSNIGRNRCPEDLINCMYLDYNRIQSDFRYKMISSYDDCHKIVVRIKNAYKNFCKVFAGSSWTDYAIAYISAWHCYKTTQNRLWLTDDSINIAYKFDNYCFISPVDLARLVAPYNIDLDKIELDVNVRPDVVQRTHDLSVMYDKYTKQKDISHTALAMQGVEV